MAFPRKLLNPGEELVLDLKPHWWFLAPSVAGVVIAVALGIVVLAAGPDRGFLHAVTDGMVGVLVLVALGYLLTRLALWVTTRFVVTTTRLIVAHGLVSKHRKEIPLDRVNDVAFRQGLFERIVGAGSLTIESAGERGQETFTNVNHPDSVQQQIYTQMEAREQRRFVGQAPPPEAPVTGPVGPATSAAGQIEQLHDLLQRGAISQAEFDAKKAELLGRM